MLVQFSVHNFRSIAATRARLHPLSVFVGANGTGKTNFIRAIELFGEILYQGSTDPVLEEGWDAVAHRTRQIRTTIDLAGRIRIPFPHDPETEASRPAGSLHVDIEVGLGHRSGDDEAIIRHEQLRLLRRQGNARSALVVRVDRRGRISVDPGDDPDLWRMATSGWALRGRRIGTDGPSVASVIEELGRRTRESGGADPTRLTINRLFNLTGWYDQNVVSRCRVQRLRLDASSLTTLGARRSALPPGELGPSGEGLANAVDRLRKEKSFGPVLRAMQEILPRLTDIVAVRSRPGIKSLAFKEEGISSYLPETAVSDGTLHALALLVAVEGRNRPATVRRPRILALEEPENAIHPWALGTVLRQADERAGRGGRQFLVTTHSPAVLDTVSPDALYIVERDGQGTTITPASEVREDLGRRLATSGMTLGEAWKMGLIGGVPRDA